MSSVQSGSVSPSSPMGDTIVASRSMSGFDFRVLTCFAKRVELQISSPSILATSSARQRSMPLLRENTNPEFYGAENNLDFSEANGVTTFRMSIKYKDLVPMEMMVENGFREGFTMTLNILEKLLATRSKQS